MFTFSRTLLYVFMFKFRLLTFMFQRKFPREITNDMRIDKFSHSE